MLLASVSISWAQPPNPGKTSEYSVIGEEGRFVAYVGMKPIILSAELKKADPKTYLEAIQAFGPAFISRVSSSGTWEWHFDDGTLYRAHPISRRPLKDKIILKLGKRSNS